ncbi:unnamed protein product [Linum trigynum]|uniref:Uncharacterized protein n=1 Tax=Linum trigynum TaxID=586398 RepID=A0AAV2DFE7_9ROSI
MNDTYPAFSGGCPYPWTSVYVVMSNPNARELAIPTFFGVSLEANDGLSSDRQPGEDDNVFEGDRHFPLGEVEGMCFGRPSLCHCCQLIIVDINPHKVPHHVQSRPL